MANLNFNFNEDKAQEVARTSSRSNSTSGPSFFNVLVWVLLGSLFAGGVAALDVWGNRNKQNAPTAQQEAPTLATRERSESSHWKQYQIRV